MSVTSWFLVSSSGTRHRLPWEMIFVGREDCELMLQSRSVDKQHAVINYDPNTDEHMVKDLGSLNGTFVNDLRIPDQTYITLKVSDVIRFGYDSHVYMLEKSQHKVPEEALKHEKYTSQLQLSIKALEARKKDKQQNSERSRDSDSFSVKLHDKTERRAHSITATTDIPISKPTPLYGQPSWWGEDDDPANNERSRGGRQPDQDSTDPAKETSRYDVNGSLSDNHTKSIYSYHREPSYFEIPTKELQQRPVKKTDSQVDEVPTKDTQNPSQCVSSAPTPPVVQSHASFTIEFDECTPGKMKIKDQVTKFSFRQQRKLPSHEVVTTPTEVMSAESKVADWLVQSNVNMMRRRRSQTEDVYSTRSDQSVQRINKAHHHEDGTHSDSEDPTHNGNDFLQLGSQTGSQSSHPPRRDSPDSEERLSITPPEPQSSPSHGKADSQKAFVIEFFDDNPRKKRSQSFTNNTAQLDKAGKGSSATGERQVPSPAFSTPPAQRYTIPLKGPGSSGPQRAGSLRREKTEDRISTSLSSRSSVSVRPFASVGRRSKLTQEFQAEFLKQARQTAPASWERNTYSSPKSSPPGTVVATQSDQSLATPPSPPAPHLAKTSSPIHQPVPLKAPMTVLASQSMEVKSPCGARNEEEDSLSDAGTYTIEADTQDKELEDARNKISQVFGVVERPEKTNQTEAGTSASYRPVINQGREQHRQSSSGELGRPASEQGESLGEVHPGDPVLKGAPKWMSRWASLADSYTESGPSSGLFDIPSQMELSGGAGGTIIHKATLSRNRDSADSEGSRARRILPKLPPGEKSESPTPNTYVHCDLQSTFDVEDSNPVALKSQNDHHRLKVQDDLEPDSLSDASKSDDGSIIEWRRRPLSDTLENNNEEDKTRLPPKSTSFYIGSDEVVSKPERGGSKPNTPKTERKQPNKTFSSATLTKQKGTQDSGKVKPSVSAPILGQDTESPETKEGRVTSLVRQESFTKDRPSNARLPNISSQPALRTLDPDSLHGASNQDTHSYLKETEDVLAALEAKLQAGQPETTSSAMMDSLSGESDVDTSSTVSQRSNKTRPNTLTKKPSNYGLQREATSSSIASQDSSNQSSVRERLSEKRRSLGADTNSKTDTGRRLVGLRRSTGKRGSTDLSDDPQSSSILYSDQESSTHHSRKKYTVPLQREDSKMSKVSQALSRSNSLSAPRPTRASMLRRARLGEASDNEGTETDRLSQEAGNAPAKQPVEPRKLSRLDMLAMPRKRTSSFNTPSDTEAASTPLCTGRTTGFSNRSTESSSSSARKASVPGPKPALQKAAPNKTPISRGRSSSAKYASSTATSHSPRNQPRPQPVVALRPKPRSRDSEDENHEGDAFHNWSSHSAEIARLSQDLAKDLAILAREIHDVAGDADAQSSGLEANTPSSTVTTHEELVQRVPDAGLNYQRVPPGSEDVKEPDQNVIVDNLMLNPVSQVSMAIRENTEKLAEKIKVLFQDKLDVWEEMEAKIGSESDVPVLKTSNKEITSILKELRRVQRQLEVINTVMEPSGLSELSKASAPVVSASPGCRPTRPPARDWRTVHSVSHRGGGPRPGDSVRRAAVTSDDVREGYLV
ncbi:centrosomal protein of 170 kDa protein B isoform X2 [Myripristis murdjan]|uniref:centrosomal protein of 170 kDa protein B isoform X2 n=1 Tax=Myripristis murdjan TaxID=586833 RepID=UPI0011761C21|nr:centrosomal protein of 170 kDa protein B-like isoform X2 [Myripristis murdjan]